MVVNLGEVLSLGINQKLNEISLYEKKRKGVRETSDC
jgi:hypothetical protein